MSSLAAFSAGFCVKVWSFIVGVFLFIPRLVHNLAVRPDDDQDHGGGHVLVWEFGQVRRLLHPFSRVASRPALGRSVGRSVGRPQPPRRILIRTARIWDQQAYRHLPSLLRSLAFKTRNLDDQLRESMLKGNLRRYGDRLRDGPMV